MRNKITIFLSHSSKDIDKVRKIRDFFEILNCDALIFYLKCLDDNNPNLEQFIKEEIAARNIFVYCRSKNSEASPWVQSEIAEIKKLGKRFYILDIEKDIAEQLITLLNNIASIVKLTRVFISYRDCDVPTVNVIKKYLKQHDYSCFSLEEIPPEAHFDEMIKGQISIASHEGMVVVVISNGISHYQKMEIEVALEMGAKIVIVFIGEVMLDMSKNLDIFPFIKISKNPTRDEMNQLLNIMFKLSLKFG